MSTKDEIRRRLKAFKKKGELTMVILCYPYEAKKEIAEGLIIPYTKELPRVLNWYNLTNKGLKYFDHEISI